MMDEQTDVDHVIDDKGKVLSTLEVERVHIQTQHAVILQDGVDLWEFHDSRTEDEQVSHQFAQNMRQRNRVHGWKESGKWIPYVGVHIRYDRFIAFP